MEEVVLQHPDGVDFRGVEPKKSERNSNVPGKDPYVPGKDPMYLERTTRFAPDLGMFQCNDFFHGALSFGKSWSRVSCLNLRVSWNPKQPVLNGWNSGNGEKNNYFSW